MFVFRSTLVVIFLVLGRVIGSSGSISYAEDIDVTFDEFTKTWQCDRLICPKDTYSCEVILENVNDFDTLQRSNVCYNFESMRILSGNWSMKMMDPKVIDIGLVFFYDSPTAAMLTYGIETQQYTGVMHSADWGKWKSIMKYNVKSIENSVSTAIWRKFLLPKSEK